MTSNMDQNTSQKTFFVVQFEQFPSYPGIPEQVVIPSDWITKSLGHGLVLVLYPVEDPQYTAKRVLEFQHPSKDWTSYLAHYVAHSIDYIRLFQYCMQANQASKSSNMNMLNKNSGPSVRQDQMLNVQKERAWDKQTERAAASGSSPTNAMKTFSAPKLRPIAPAPQIQPVNLNQQYAPAPTTLPNNDNMIPYMLQLQNLANAHGNATSTSNSNITYSYSNVEINTATSNVPTYYPRLPYTSVLNQKLITTHQGQPRHNIKTNMTWAVPPKQSANNGNRASNLPHYVTATRAAFTVTGPAIPLNNGHEQNLPNNNNYKTNAPATHITILPKLPSSVNTNQQNPPNRLSPYIKSPSNIQANVSQNSPQNLVKNPQNSGNILNQRQQYLNKTAEGLKQDELKTTMGVRRIESKCPLPHYITSNNGNMYQNSSMLKSEQASSLQSLVPVTVLEQNKSLTGEDDEEPKLVIDESVIQTPTNLGIQDMANQSYTSSENVNKLNPQDISTFPITNTQLSKPPVDSFKSAPVVNNYTENISKNCGSTIKISPHKSTSNNVLTTVSTPAKIPVSSTNKTLDSGAQENVPSSHTNLVPTIKLRGIDEPIETIKSDGHSHTSEMSINSLHDVSQMPNTEKATIQQDNRKRPNEMPPDNAKKQKVMTVEDKVIDIPSPSNANNVIQLSKELNRNDSLRNLENYGTNSSSLYTNISALKKLNTSCEPVFSIAAVGQNSAKDQNISSDQNSNSSVLDIKIRNLKQFGDLSLKLDAANTAMFKKTHDLMAHVQEYVTSNQKFSNLMNKIMHPGDKSCSNNSLQSKENYEVGKTPIDSKEIYETDSVSTGSSVLQEVKNDRVINDELSQNQAKKKLPENLNKVVPLEPDSYYVIDSRRTLKYPNPGLGLEELIPGSNIYVNSVELLECKEKAGPHLTSMARQLLKLIFKREALEVCSFTGTRPKSSQYPHRPGLDKNGRETLSSYVLNHCKPSDLKNVDSDSLTTTMHNILHQYRVKKQWRNRSCSCFVKKSCPHIKQKRFDIEL